MKLDRMRELLARLGNPHERMPLIHVAGTKGKGSTAAMIAAILSAAGYRSGLFTSPHLDRIEERIAVDGHPCSGDELAELVERVRPVVEAMDRESFPSLLPASFRPPTYFEIVTAMAFDHFRRRGVDAAVLEVGLGGRLDSTNVCSPCRHDHHQHQLRPHQTVGRHAGRHRRRKGRHHQAGRAGHQRRRRRRAEGGDSPHRPEKRLPTDRIGRRFRFRLSPPAPFGAAAVAGTVRLHPVKPRPLVAPTPRPMVAALHRVALGLLGRHQAANAAVALAAVEELRQSGWTIPEAAIRRGLAEVAWPARVEVVARRPTVVLDAAHNVASIAALVEVLDESFSAARRLLIFATTQEKDHRGMLQQLLGRFDHVIFTRYSNNPRSVPPEELLGLAREISPLPQCGRGAGGEGGDNGNCGDASRSLGRGSPPSNARRPDLHHRLVLSGIRNTPPDRHPTVSVCSKHVITLAASAVRSRKHPRGKSPAALRGRSREAHRASRDRRGEQSPRRDRGRRPGSGSRGSRSARWRRWHADGSSP